jgi:hypothetical protein
MRWLPLTLCILLAGGVSIARAQTPRKGNASGPTLSGVVKAVSNSSLTVERDGTEVVFGVTSSTRVLWTGRSGKAGPPEQYYPNGARDLVLRNAPKFTDVVKPGDRVTVRFRQSGSALQAVEVRIDPTP